MIGAICTCNLRGVIWQALFLVLTAVGYGKKDSAPKICLQTHPLQEFVGIMCEWCVIKHKEKPWTS